MISVLYIDDSEVLLDLGKIFLERDGKIKVDTAISADEAIEILNDTEYDLIISDYEMPEKSGIDLLKYLREQGNDIPFIIFTGKSREEIVIQALNCGADYYVQKGGEPNSLFTELIYKLTLAVERKRTFLALKNSNERVSYILDLLPVATLVTNMEGEVLIWNKALEKMTGCMADQMIGKGNYSYAIPFHGQSQPMLIDRIQSSSHIIPENYLSCTKEGNIVTAEIEISLPDTSVRILKGIASPLFDSDKEIIGSIEIISDITEEKLIEKNRALLASVVENSDDAIVVLSLKGIISSWNNGATRIFGYDSVDTIGKKFTSIIHLEPPYEFSLIIQKLAAGELIHLITTYHRIKDKKNIHVLLSISPIRNSDGFITEISISGRDISDIKEMEISLRESEKRFRDLFELSTTVMLILYQKTGGIIHANDAASLFYGYSVDEMVGMNISDLEFFGTDRAGNRSLHVSNMQVSPLTFQHLTKSGDIRDVEIYSVPIIQNDTTILYSIIIDVTDKKRLNKALIESELRYRNVVEDQSELISRFLPDGTNTFVNSAYYRYFDPSKTNAKEIELLSVVYEGDRKSVMEHLNSLDEQENVGTIEHRVVRWDGTIRWMSSNCRRIVDDTHCVVEYQVVSSDITDRIEAENELIQKNIDLEVANEQISATEEEMRESINEMKTREQDLQSIHDLLQITTEKLHLISEDLKMIEQSAVNKDGEIITILESSFDPGYITDGELFVYVNSALIEFLGVSDINELIGDSIYKWISPGWETSIQECFNSILSEDLNVKKVTYECLNKDSVPVLVTSAFSQVTYDFSKMCLVFIHPGNHNQDSFNNNRYGNAQSKPSIITDFTSGFFSNPDNFNLKEKKSLSDTGNMNTISSEFIHHVLFENSDSMMVLFDKNLLITDINSRFASVSGYSKDEVEKVKLLTEFYVQDNERRELDSDIIWHMIHHADHPQHSFGFATKDGQIREMFISFSYISVYEKWIASFSDGSNKN